MPRRAGLCPSKSNNETDQTARPMAKRLSVKYNHFFTIFDDDLAEDSSKHSDFSMNLLCKAA